MKFVINTGTYYVITGTWIIISLIIFFALLKVTAPYGRHTRQGWGPVLSERIGWLLMEFPSVAVMPILFALSPAVGTTVPLLFLLLWELHYINRTFIYPFRIRGNQKLMPLFVALMAFFFTIVNGYLNGVYIFYLADKYNLRWLGNPRFLGGLTIFFTGFFINQVSDRILRNMRRKNEDASSYDGRYGIPEGFLFERVSCPNYFGEMVEWLGWAVLTWSLAGLAFFVWTAANLIPRALSHHRWYNSVFDQYPEKRYAVIPYVL
jgi:3-oxo-5-alpha-steroid 4-dehydrogenase 1